MDGFLWPLLLIAVGMLLLALEMFIPSGGALGLFAALAFIGAIVLGFMHNTYAGASSLLAVSFIVPLFFAFFVYYWPKTPLGKRMLLRHDPDEQLVVDDEEEQLRTLIGRRGRAKTKMLPSGAVTIDGQTYDAATEGIALDPGQPIEVIALRMKRLVVRPVENDAMPLPAAQDPNDLLSQPYDKFGLSPFEDPLV
jgi:membrane-bound ClpP family serine protease